MAYFHSLHSHLQVLSKEDLKGTRIEHGFKRAFLSLFSQDNETFTSTMLLNVDQLQKQLDKDEFQEDGSMTAFWVINRQFQMFIDSHFTLDYDNQMTSKYFAEYTGIEVKQFRETLLHHMSNVKKSVAERTRHKRLYDRRVNKRQMQKQESKVDLGKALNADADDADIQHIYDKELMDESIENADLKAQIQEKVFAIAALKNELRNLKGNRVDTKFAKPSILGKSVLQPLRKQLVVRQPTAFKSERPQFQNLGLPPKSDLRWKPTDRIFTTVGLRWIPTGKLLVSYTGKVNNEPPYGSNVDISNIHECKQTLDLSACTSINVQKKQSIDLSVAEDPIADMIVMTSMIELEILFGPLFDEYLNEVNQVVLKSSIVTTADASNKRQQQPYLTSSTSTLATTITADGNFNLYIF
ncbi:hypothetical protein Tco_1430199 [Tanacetum coccineum]